MDSKKSENHHKTRFAIFIAGGNGTGKTTLVKNTILPKFKNEFGKDINFINADEWQREKFGGYENVTEEMQKEAQEWANQERERCINEGESFITETVFSHSSKVNVLKEAAAKGFFVILYHIGIDGDGEEAVRRVAIRVALKGHDVPEEKIKNRAKRANPLIAEASKYSDETYVYDNSTFDEPHKLILHLKNGELVNIFDIPPQWVQDCYPV